MNFQSLVVISNIVVGRSVGPYDSDRVATWPKFSEPALFFFNKILPEEKKNSHESLNDLSSIQASLCSIVICGAKGELSESSIGKLLRCTSGA